MTDKVIENIEAAADSDISDTAKILIGLHGIGTQMVALASMIEIVASKVDRLERAPEAKT